MWLAASVERWQRRAAKASRGMRQTFFSAPLCSASKKLYQKQARYTRAFLLVKLFFADS